MPLLNQQHHRKITMLLQSENKTFNLKLENIFLCQDLARRLQAEEQECRGTTQTVFVYGKVLGRCQ